MSSIIGQLRVLLSLDSAAFETGTKRAEARADALGNKAEALGYRVGAMGKAMIAAGAAVAGSAVFAQVQQLVTQGLEYASALGEQAQQLGVTTKALQEYRYAASQAGMSAEEMDQALGQLTKRMGEGATGNKAMAEAFAKLGIDIKAFVAAGGDAGDLIPKIAEGLTAIKTPAEQAAIVVDLFGKSGQKLMPLLSEGAQGVNSLRDAAQRLGLVLSSEQIQKADEAADKLDALKQVLSARIAGVVADNADKIIALANAVEQLATRAGRLYDALVRLNDSRVGKALNGLAWAADHLNPANNAGRALGTALDMYDAATAPRSGGGKTSAPVRNSPMKGAGTTMAPEFLQWSGKSGFASPTMLAVPIPLLETINTIVPRTQEEIDALTESVNRLAASLFPAEAKLREYENQMGQIGDAENAGILSPERASTMRQALIAQSEGVASLFDQIRYGQEATLETTDIVAQGLEELGRTGQQAGQAMKGSFVDAANTMISAIDRIGYAFSSGGGGGGGFLGKLSAVLNFGMQLGGLGLFGGKAQSYVQQLSGARADGGPVNAGGLYLVGERGPELFAPGQSGQIVPNHKMGGAQVQVIPSPYFDVVVDGRLQRGAPLIAAAGAEGGVRRMAYQQSRRLG